MANPGRTTWALAAPEAVQAAVQGYARAAEELQGACLLFQDEQREPEPEGGHEVQQPDRGAGLKLLQAKASRKNAATEQGIPGCAMLRLAITPGTCQRPRSSHARGRHPAAPAMAWPRATTSAGWRPLVNSPVLDRDVQRDARAPPPASRSRSRKVGWGVARLRPTAGTRARVWPRWPHRGRRKQVTGAVVLWGAPAGCPAVGRGPGPRPRRPARTPAPRRTPAVKQQPGQQAEVGARVLGGRGPSTPAAGGPAVAGQWGAAGAWRRGSA